jgi:hypothetical protein
LSSLWKVTRSTDPTSRELLPRRLHTTEPAARHRLPEQACHLRPLDLDEGGGRNDGGDRR